MFSRFVAIGDSQSEGLDDGDDSAGYRGWADRLAERLAEIDPDVQYANLAIRGRLACQVREEQLAPALALRPDLASVVAGVNDLLRPWDRLHLDADGHDRLAAAAATVLGLPGTEVTWQDSLGPLPPVTVPGRLRADAEWAVRFLGPWLGRRLRGTSSGVGRVAKRPALMPVRVG